MNLAEWARMRANHAAAAARLAIRKAEARENDSAAFVAVEERLAVLGQRERLADQLARHDRYGAYYEGGPQLVADLAAISSRAANERLADHRWSEHETRTFDGARERRDAGSGAFAGTVVPQYLTGRMASAVRATAPLVARLEQPLPAGGMSIVETSWSTPSSSTAQSAENTALTEVDVATSALTELVKTYPAWSQVALQAIERGMVTDQLLADQALATTQRIDADLIGGAGSAGTLTGILAASGTTAQTWNDATPTAAEFVTQLETAYRTSTTNGGVAPDLCVLHPRRWSWLREKAVAEGLTLPATARADGVPVWDGRLEMILDANVPTTLGAGTEDAALVFAARSVCVNTSPPSVYRDTSSAADALAVKLVTFRQVSAGCRFASSIVKIGGTGLIAV